MNVEILIYIKKVKDLMKKDEEIKTYFLDDIGNSDIFLKHVTNIAEKNFEERGDPSLTPQQFEIIRKIMKVLVIKYIFMDSRGYYKKV